MFDSALVTCFFFGNIILTKTDPLTLNLKEHYQCAPNKIYKNDNRTCVCTSNGTWPNEKCVLNFSSKKRYEDCDPNKYIFVDCNVCLCGPDGKINKSRCTQHNCIGSNSARRSDAIVGACDPKSFYVLAPCQFCYCVSKHKLVCNSKPKSIIVSLGQYELNKCDNNLIKELTDLVPDKHQRSQKKAKKTKSGSAKKPKMLTTAILLDDYNVDNMEELVDSDKKYSQTDKKEYKNDKNKMAYYDKDESDITKVIKSDDSLEIPKKKSFKRKSKLVESITEAYSDLNENNQSYPVTIDIPSVLDKVLNLVLRKSMVSLESGQNCRVGDTIKEKCNTCYCLSNGKLLCTKNTCE